VRYMGRSDRRRKERNAKKSEVRYYYTTQQLYDKAFEISNRILESMGIEVRDSFKKAMRENRVSEIRANRILNRANELLEKNTKKKSSG
jgi:hypothetical protein